MECKISEAAIAETAANPRTEPRPVLRPEALAAPDSGIVEVFNYCRGREGLIPLFVGEGDLPAPAFITDAAIQSIANGETFYTYQRGIPDLREAIAHYMARHYGQPFEKRVTPFAPDRFFVTIGGMHALQIAIRLIAGLGDEVIVPTPAWPNFYGALTVSGARPIEVPLRFTEKADWSLDLDRMAAAITPKTRALIVNSPANPTGWIATHEDLKNLLGLARQHGLWIIADEIYGRIVFDEARAPSFHDVMEKDDSILFIQTFSKNWAMTGLRLGWLEAPPRLASVIENLVQYSTSGVAAPWQRAGVAALNQGEAFFANALQRVKTSRDILYDGLIETGRVVAARPRGAFYLFCRIEGESDTRALALRLVDEANVGVAPGTAFGAGGADFLRLCFARDPSLIAEATRRLSSWLGRRAR